MNRQHKIEGSGSEYDTATREVAARNSGSGVQSKSGMLMTLAITAVMIALGAFFLFGLLNANGGPSNRGIHTGTLQQAFADDSAELESLQVITYLRNLSPPENSVTAQYAVAATSEIAERVFGKPLAGRVFVVLGKSYGESEPLYWDVQAEVEGGTVNCTIDCLSGVERAAHYWDTLGSWDWFDAWDEEVAEEERLEGEQRMQELEALQESYPQDKTPTLEEHAALMEQKRQAMLAHAQETADDPHNAAAIDLVNSLGLGGGAQAVSATLPMETGSASSGDGAPLPIESVEVVLDDGTSLMVHLGQGTMKLFSYERYEKSFAEATYEQAMTWQP